MSKQTFKGLAKAPADLDCECCFERPQRDCRMLIIHYVRIGLEYGDYTGYGAACHLPVLRVYRQYYQYTSLREGAVRSRTLICQGVLAWIYRFDSEAKSPLFAPAMVLALMLSKSCYSSFMPAETQDW